MIALSNFISNSAKHVKSELSKVINHKGTKEFKSYQTLYDFTKEDTVTQFLTGCDNSSKCKLEFKGGCGHFHGDISANGYAIMRSKLPPLTMFGRFGFNVSDFTILEIEAKSNDDHQYYLNLRTDSFATDHVYQTKLQFPKNDEFQVIQIPFSDFILTHRGYIMQRQSPIDRNNIQAVGLSLLKSPGKFSTLIKQIRVFNPMAQKYEKSKENSLGYKFFGRDSK
eukprot:NODE_126_length_18761_cov_0.476262.p6 type:complete len:224 gc:universal NODE_126_length_18761_cov_0.476262:778-1449(+)